MTKLTHEAFNKYGRHVGMALVLLLMAGILILWGWNTLAVELFGATTAKFRHALALEAVLGGLWLAAYAMGAAMEGPQARAQKIGE